MKNRVKYTDKEWEELASMLSGEEMADPELLKRFNNEDIQGTGEKWKVMKENNGLNEIDIEKAWESVSSRLEQADYERTEIRKATFGNIFLRAAAIALLIIISGAGAYLIFNEGASGKQIVYTTGDDQRNLLIALDDGSKVFLNRNSELSFSKNFGEKGRNVSLNGEAFFDIAPDTEKPFSINAGNALIRVTGTSFNVITSNRDSEVEVFVKTGRVILEDPENRKSIELDPGYIGKIDATKAERSVNTDPNYLSWNTGLLVYDGQTLEVVFRDLKRVYNMDIVADDISILENRWTSPIDNQNEETIIRLICASFNLDYTKVDNAYHLIRK